MRELALAIFASAMFTGCLSWFAKDPENSARPPAGEPAPESVNTEDATKKSNEEKYHSLEEGPAAQTAVEGLELKQARLWARVDELENLLIAQKARIKLLEKGLMLGVIPDELNEPVEKRPVVDSPLQIVADKPSVVATGEKAASIELPKNTEVAAEIQEKIIEAKELFRAGHYGKAYVEFSKIDREFSDQISSGEQKYWLGRCWYQLKEYQSAIQTLQQFIDAYPKTTWAPSAKFFLAKAELDSGLREVAVKHFQEIIRDHPYEPTAEAAKLAIGSLEKAL